MIYRLPLSLRSMARKNISSGSEFESKIGYSRAVVVHPWIIISGTTGSVRSLPCRVHLSI